MCVYMLGIKTLRMILKFTNVMARNIEKRFNGCGHVGRSS